MNNWILEFTHKLPNKFDLIVGIPRSGLPFASTLAGKFGKPMTTNGSEIWYGRFMDKIETIKTILVCDDSLSTGNLMAHTINTFKALFPSAILESAVIVVQPGSAHRVNHWYKEIEHPRMFEWNLAHGKWGKLACDMDGVICKDWPQGLIEQDVPDKYAHHITNALPAFIPNYSIDTIVSCRLEKYRVPTELWLQRYGVKYRNLILWNANSPLDRAGKHTQYKTEQIKKVEADYVFESDWAQAVGIARALKLPVLCFDTMTMLGEEIWII